MDRVGRESHEGCGSATISKTCEDEFVELDDISRYHCYFREKEAISGLTDNSPPPEIHWQKPKAKRSHTWGSMKHSLT
jgi:hypothetical protein